MTKTIIIAALTLAVVTTETTADVLRCKIEGYNEDVFITTLPDTNQDDGRYARIGISPGIGDRALVFADHMGANVFTAPRWAAYGSKEYARDQIKSGDRCLRHGYGAIPK